MRHVHSRERLVDHVAFFLHRRVDATARGRSTGCSRTCTSRTRRSPGRKVLIVDDDIRNIFALASVLEEHGMTVISADNGRDALRIMAQQAPTSTSC